MKNLLLPFFLILFLIQGCSSNTNDSISSTNTLEISDDSLVSIDETPTDIESMMEVEATQSESNDKDYQEFYETGKLKIEGDYDDSEARHGLWVSYYENGIKWSESHYTHGKKFGHSITFFPNGKVRYVGEYADDKQVGHWSFYDEDGNLVKEEDY